MRDKALSFGRNKNPVPLRRVLFYFVGGCVHARLLAQFDRCRPLAAEVQGVIALRLIRLASGGSEASAEMSRMVTEKFTALSAGHAAATSAFLSGNNPVQIMSSALLPIKRRVRKNRHRLAGLRR
jgi:hypothetical protein